jgi:hypothetical protein
MGWQGRPRGRPSRELALVAQAEAQGTYARCKSQAPGVGDGQGDPSINMNQFEDLSLLFAQYLLIFQICPGNRLLLLTRVAEGDHAFHS